MDEHERMQQAEAQVEAFITILTRRYGIDEREIPHLVDGIRWAITHKESLDKLNFGALMAVLATVIAALLIAIWEGVRHLVQRGA